MSLEERYRISAKSWNELASAYAAAFMHLDDYHETYEALVHAVKTAQPHLLEIGCGPGNISAYISQRYPQFRITATDLAPAMIEIAQKNLPAAKCLVMDARDIRKLDQQFDAIVAGFCIPYLAEADTAKLLADVAVLLNDEGVFYLSYLEGDYANSRFESGSNTSLETFVHYYGADFILEALHQNGFTIRHEFRFPFTRKNGQVLDQHILIAARK